MIYSVAGVRRRKDSVVRLLDTGKLICVIQTRYLKDAHLIANIVAASIEIDEITKQDNRAHE